MGNLLAFEVGEVSQGLLCSWQSDCFLLGISCGLVFGVGGRMWSVYSTSSSCLISGDIHKRRTPGVPETSLDSLEAAVGIKMPISAEWSSGSS